MGTLLSVNTGVEEVVASENDHVKVLHAKGAWVAIAKTVWESKYYSEINVGIAAFLTQPPPVSD